MLALAWSDANLATGFITIRKSLEQIKTPEAPAPANEAERMRAVVRVVTEMGVQIKGLDPALIDFPAFRDGRVVFLCWQEGEATISHWHDIEAGFAGREPL